MAAGLLKLAGVTGEDRWATVAGELLDVGPDRVRRRQRRVLRHGDDGERLIFRPADPTDNATPSGAFAAADALLSYAALTGDDPVPGGGGGRAARCCRRSRPSTRGPAGLGLAVAEALLSGPAEIAIVGPDDDPRTADLLRAALHAAPPGAVFALGQGAGDSDGPAARRPAPGLRRAPRPTSAAISLAWRRSQPRRRFARRCAGPDPAPRVLTGQ